MLPSSQIWMARNLYFLIRDKYKMLAVTCSIEFCKWQINLFVQVHDDIKKLKFQCLRYRFYVLLLFFTHTVDVIVTRTTYLCSVFFQLSYSSLPTVTAQAGGRWVMFQRELQKQPGTNCCQMHKVCCGVSLHNVLIVGNPNC